VTPCIVLDNARRNVAAARRSSKAAQKYFQNAGDDNRRGIV
jgi:hypothetical protein